MTTRSIPRSPTETSRPRIFLMGLTSVGLGGMEAGNLGNYMIIEPLVAGLRAEYPTADITTSLQLSDAFCDRFHVTSLHSKRFWTYGRAAALATARDMARLPTWLVTDRLRPGRAVSLPRGSELLSQISAADLVIDFSGDLFGDNAGFNKFLEGCAEIAFAEALARPVAMLAGSPGPFSGWRRPLARFVLSRVSLITNREPISSDLLVQLGVDASTIENTACPAFLFEGKSADEVEPVLRREGIRQATPTVGLILSGWNMPEAPYDQVARERWELVPFVRLIESLMGDLDAQVVLLSHSHRQQDDGQLAFGPDAAILEQLSTMVSQDVGNGSLVLLSQPYDAATTKGLVGTFDMLVSGRLHGAISGLSQCIPTVLIDYGHKPRAHKLRGVARLLRIEQYVCDPSDSRDLVRTAAMAWHRREHITAHLQRVVPWAESQAMSNFRLLRKLL